MAKVCQKFSRLNYLFGRAGAGMAPGSINKCVRFFNNLCFVHKLYAHKAHFIILKGMRRAFTLVELLIVVAIMGILAAVVLPAFQNSTQKAKEAAAKDNLQILRNAIGLYAAQHNGIPPGYINDNTETSPSYMALGREMTDLEHRLSKMPENPFNNIAAMLVLPASSVFPHSPVNTKLYGWIYKPTTKNIRLNWPGNDSKGIAYFSY